MQGAERRATNNWRANLVGHHHLFFVNSKTSAARGQALRIFFLQEMDEAFAKKDVARVREVVVQIWVDGFHRTPDQVDPVVREKVGTMMIDNFKQHQSEQITDEPLTPPAVGRLAEIKAPTLVIVGAVDVSPILAGVDKLAAGIPGARKVVIENTAHVPNMEQPAEFNRLVLDFLSSVERG